MCTQVVTMEGHWLGSVEKLREAGFVVLPGDYDTDVGVDEYAAEQFCLCGADIEAILDRSGIPYDQDPAGFYDLRAPIPCGRRTYPLGGPSEPEGRRDD